MLQVIDLTQETPTIMVQQDTDPLLGEVGVSGARTLLLILWTNHPSIERIVRSQSGVTVSKTRKHHGLEARVNIPIEGEDFSLSLTVCPRRSQESANKKALTLIRNKEGVLVRTEAFRALVKVPRKRKEEEELRGLPFFY